MIHKNFAVDGSPDIDVSIESGRVEVHRSRDGDVAVSVDTELPDFIVEQRGNSILISSDKSASWLSRGSAHVVIEAPEGSDLRVSVASALVDVDVPLGKVEIKTASGDIDLAKAETLLIKSASGDANVTLVERAVRFNSASGDLRVRDSVAGTVAVSTASGDVHINEATATLHVNTVSGDADIRRFTGRNATFKTVSGTVDLGIPGGTDVSLDVNLLSGTLRVPDPEPRTEPPQRQMSITAKLVSGDFNIDRI